MGPFELLQKIVTVFELLYQKADEVSKMIQGFMNYLNNSSTH